MINIAMRCVADDETSVRLTKYCAKWGMPDNGPEAPEHSLGLELKPGNLARSFGWRSK
jgi:hypothetical protein